MTGEQELIARCKDGDVAAFEELIGNYQKKVVNAAYAMLGSREDAYDIAQEIFLKVFCNISSFSQQSSFSTWLYKVARNMCLDEIRRRQRQNADIVNITQESEGESYEIQIADSAQGPPEQAERAELQRFVREAINALPDDYREVLIMREIEDLDYKQIADVLGCSLGTVKSRISRGRRLLHEKLLPYKELFL